MDEIELLSLLGDSEGRMSARRGQGLEYLGFDPKGTFKPLGVADEEGGQYSCCTCVLQWYVTPHLNGSCPLTISWN